MPEKDKQPPPSQWDIGGDTDTLDDVKRKGLEQEWQLYPECIQHFAQGTLKTVNMTHTLDNGNLYRRTVVKVAQSA